MQPRAYERWKKFLQIQRKGAETAGDGVGSMNASGELLGYCVQIPLKTHPRMNRNMRLMKALTCIA
jgi:hypothetical protein